MTLSIQHSVSLKDRNGLAIEASAEQYVSVASLEALAEAAAYARKTGLPVLALGAGSNLVPTSDIGGIVISVDLPGVEVTGQRIVAGAGENWHSLVAGCVRQGLFGLENLALIPGTVGAAPIQNIGAYGAQVADCLKQVTVFHLETLESAVLGAADCEFGYRSSLFKKEKHWVVTGIELELSADQAPNVEYPGITGWLEREGREATCENVFDAVVSIRRSKLPDPAVTPNVGSFFKNPIQPVSVVETIARSDMPVYQVDDEGLVKLSAGWLIDQAGLKGAKEGGMMVSEQHALVVINTGEGSGSDLLRLIQTVQNRVVDEFGIMLEIEPSIIP